MAKINPLETEVEKTDLIEYSVMLWNRIVNKGLLSIDDINVLSNYGLTTGLMYINEILQSIEENGELSTRKRYTNRFLYAITMSIESEFHFRTFHFFQSGKGSQIPIELLRAFMNLSNAIVELDFELTFGKHELVNEISQVELIYLFKALASAKVFHRSPTLIADSLHLLTNYPFESLEKNAKNTFGGLNPDNKAKLLNKLKIILNSY